MGSRNRSGVRVGRRAILGRGFSPDSRRRSPRSWRANHSGCVHRIHLPAARLRHRTGRTRVGSLDSTHMERASGCGRFSRIGAPNGRPVLSGATAAAPCLPHLGLGRRGRASPLWLRTLSSRRRLGDVAGIGRSVRTRSVSPMVVAVRRRDQSHRGREPASVDDRAGGSRRGRASSGAGSSDSHRGARGGIRHCAPGDFQRAELGPLEPGAARHDSAQRSAGRTSSLHTPL